MSASRPVKSKYHFFKVSQPSYEFKFDPIKSFLNKSEQMILDQQTDIEKRFKQWVEKYKNYPDVPEAPDQFYDELNSNSIFPYILNQSIFITAYSMYEYELFSLCDYCENIEDIGIVAKDLAGGNYIEKCKKYLTKVIHIDMDNLEEQGMILKKYQSFRNSFVHKDGILKGSHRDILAFISKTDGISFEVETNQLTIESIVFVKDFIDVCTNYLIDLSNEIYSQKKDDPKFFLDWAKTS